METSETARRSCVIIPLLKAPPQLLCARRMFDPLAHSSGLPLHLTVLFPFAEAHDLSDGMLEILACAAAQVDPIRITLTGIEHFERVAYLTVQPVGTLVAALDQLRGTFPEYQVYNGMFAQPTPHVSIGFSKDPHATSTMARVASQSIDGALPFTWLADRLTVAVETAAFQWECVANLPFAGGHHHAKALKRV